MRRTSVLLVLLVAAAVVAVWRFGAPTSGLAAEGQPSGSVPVEEGSPEPSATAPSIPAHNEMSVFSGPRSDADVLPSEYSYRLHIHMNCSGWEQAHDACVGDDVASESRLLLADLGATHANLYAWPTTSSGVCWAFGEGSGSCSNSFDLPGGRANVMGLDPDAAKSGAPATVVGVVPDDVVAAEVVVHGVAHAVSVENNALFYELPDIAEFPCQAVDSVTVLYRDGSSDTFGRRELSWGWRRSAVDIGDDPCRLSS